MSSAPAEPVPRAGGGGSLLLRPDSLVLATGGGTVVTFDRAGRLYSVFSGGRSCRRGVDGTVVSKYTDGDTVRRPLDPGEVRQVVAHALAAARTAPSPGGAEGAALARARRFDLDADAARFRRLYRGRVPILPPDLYRAVVLQATVGCSYNRCLFCRLYRDRRFSVPGAAEFGRHAEAVRRAFGPGLSMRRGVFLGDADALVLQTAPLERRCAVAAGLAPAEAGLFCFGTVAGGPARRRSEWEALRGAGLRRVYLGVETGHDPLRARLRKPGRGSDVLRLVAALKEAGIAAGLIFLLGVGGEAFEPAHLRDTAALCRAAGLDGDDFVYLAPLVGPGGVGGRARAQHRALLEELALPPHPRGPRLAPYDIRAFVY
ncbi:MAG: radical SAM protein [Planctomycetota bacterium]